MEPTAKACYRILGSHRALGRRSRRFATVGLAVSAVILALSGVTAAQAATTPGAPSAGTASGTGSGLPPIKHVWFIILENKSYDATFTGLNNNTYLWKTLPAQGTLLTNYYGTGHFSLDNYVALVSGQAPTPDDQNDCPVYKDLQGSVATTPNASDYGQFVTAGAPYQANEGCVYPASVPTLFNQLDAAHVSWKGYAQDLGNPDSSGPPHDAGGCGGPSLNPTSDPVIASTNASSFDSASSICR